MTARYVTATTVEEAVAAMAAGARPIAGGTDLVVTARQGRAPLPASLVGIHRLAELATIEGPDARGLRIGALVTHASIMAHPAVLAAYPAIADASAIVGSPSTRANGTLGGNVMNASPAMDTGAPLLCHGAVAVLNGPREIRRIGLDQLWTAPGQVSASPDELLIAVELPPPRTEPGIGSGSAYVRLQYRRQMEIAVVGAAAAVTVARSEILSARIALTAVAPTVRRVPEAEAVLIGADLGAIVGAAGGGANGAAGRGSAAVRAAAELAAGAVSPISDVRASASYRRAMTVVVVRRAVTTAVLRACGNDVPVPASDTTFGS